MWKSNKVGIIVLLAGAVALGTAYALVQGERPLLARQIVAVGVCALLFGVALGTWLSVRRDLRQRETPLERR